MDVPSRVARVGLVMLLCWRVSFTQESQPDWRKTALVVANVPVGLALIYDLSLHRFDGLTPRAPHWRPQSIPDGSHGWDVAGNALYSYVLTRTFRHGYEYAGFSPVASTLLAGGNVLLFHTYIKYRESLYWGAQAHDLFGAWGGISLAILQGIVPEFERVQYKWFWYDTRKDKAFDYSFLEEYRTQRFYVSVRLGDIFFKQKFLQGFGLAYGGGPRGDRRVRDYLGLDYDIRVLLPGFLGEALNYIHIPLPSLYYDGNLKFGLSL